MKKPRRRSQKARRTKREWDKKLSFTQVEILKATAEKGVSHGWSSKLS